MIGTSLNHFQLKLSGEPFRVAENLGLSGGDVSAYAFSVSPRGTIVYCNSQLHPTTQLTWFNRKGELLGTVGDAGPTSEAHGPEELATVLGYEGE